MTRRRVRAAPRHRSEPVGRSCNDRCASLIDDPALDKHNAAFGTGCIDGTGRGRRPRNDAADEAPADAKSHFIRTG